ncbi:MAG TPA: hypothetical protein VJI74_01500 [Candidatus Paceibacterota bacterium]
MTPLKVAIRKIEPLQRLLFWSFSGMALLCVGLYIFFILHSISLVLTRADLERQISRTQSQLSELELQYVGRKDTLNLAVAESLGFVTVAGKEFIAKKALTQKPLSFNAE